MNRRTYEGPMDWEYEGGKRPMDLSSPFAKLAKDHPNSSLSSPTKPQSSNPNPFAFPGTPRETPLKPSPFKQSPFKTQDQPRPPHASFFTPRLEHKPSAPAFRNPAFTTPQRRLDELVFSPYSGAESSPAMTDTSDMPAETPEFDRDDEILRSPVTPSAGRSLISRTLLKNHASGRGEILRGNRDKVRKRKRQQGDRDVGSVRPRLSHDSDDSDSDWEDGQDSPEKERKAATVPQRGWFSGFLSAISDHPSAPAILSKWLQLGFNIVMVSLAVFGLLFVVYQIRSDLSYANEKARAALTHEMATCATDFVKNNCDPAGKRPPALEEQCNRWEACMNQDASAIMQLQVSVRNIAEIVNEFVGVLTVKAWVFMLSLFVVAVVGSNAGFRSLRESTLTHPTAPPPPAQPLHSPPAMPSLLGSAVAHNPREAYLFAPLSQTPRHIRNKFFFNDATDSEASPEAKMLLPPQTPSGRRSPSKGERERTRSPVKGSRGRSPVKGY
ncbi:Di-sulfide bridge nucleocytoplasmic transport domain-containing protein [Chaetomium sp. MPI-SDFR-AT-0129]|nr:Di-sulfide bridge nucleocytoplasmic transport domain-containing protein [Chaetomium sp. MPI-SDFR-AT-0129]